MTAEQIKSRIDFAKLMKDKIFDPSELISVNDIRHEVNKQKNILGPRTIEFYARYGLLKKSLRITGDKKAYYNRDYIFDALGLIFLLKATYGFKLSEIKMFMRAIRHNCKGVFTDLMGLDDLLKEKKDLNIKVSDIDDTPKWMVDDMMANMRFCVGRTYIEDILKNKNPNMMKFVEKAEDIYLHYYDKNPNRKPNYPVGG